MCLMAFILYTTHTYDIAIGYKPTEAIEKMQEKPCELPYFKTAVKI